MGIDDPSKTSYVGGLPDPLGGAVVLYAAGPIPGTFAYAAPPLAPWDTPIEPFPSLPIPTVPAMAPAAPSAVEQRLAALERGVAEIKGLLETVLAGMKVREAMQAMLDALTKSGPRKEG